MIVAYLLLGIFAVTSFIAFVIGLIDGACGDNLVLTNGKILFCSYIAGFFTGKWLSKETSK